MPASLLVIARGAQIAASLLLAGIFTFEIVILRAASRFAEEADPVQMRFLRLVWWSLAVAFLSALLWFAFEVTDMSGRALAQAFSDASWQKVLFATRFGRVWQLRLGLIAACLALVTLRLSRQRWRNPLTFALWLVSGALLASLAQISHAAAAGVQPLGLLGDGLHLFAAGAWIGGLPCLAICLTNISDVFAARILQRFSALSLCCVSLLVVSGLSNAWLLVGSFHALFTTPYGALLLFKLALFAILLGFGARNRLLVKANLLAPGAQPELLARLRRNVRYEIGLGFAVVAIVGWLGATAPPRPSAPTVTATDLVVAA